MNVAEMIVAWCDAARQLQDHKDNIFPAGTIVRIDDDDPTEPLHGFATVVVCDDEKHFPHRLMVRVRVGDFPTLSKAHPKLRAGDEVIISVALDRCSPKKELA